MHILIVTYIYSINFIIIKHAQSLKKRLRLCSQSLQMQYLYFIIVPDQCCKCILGSDLRVPHLLLCGSCTNYSKLRYVLFNFGRNLQGMVKIISTSCSYYFVKTCKIPE